MGRAAGPRSGVGPEWEESREEGVPDSGQANPKMRVDVASNRENILGRGWGVGVVMEHTRLEKPVGKAHTRSHGSLPALKEGSLR